MSSTITARVWKRARRFASALRIAYARTTGVKIGDGCRLGPGSDLALGFDPSRRGTLELGANCGLAAGAILHPYNGFIRIGLSTFVGPHTAINGHGGVPIGEGSLLAMHCRILASNHFIPPLHVIATWIFPGVGP